MSMETINKENFQAAFVNTSERPIKVEHVCYYTKSGAQNSGKTLQLVEVVKETYSHPDTDELHVTIFNEYVREETLESHARPHTILLKNIQKDVKSAMKVQ